MTTTTTPNSLPDLLPCPFCGGEGSVVYDSGNEVYPQRWYVGCTKCSLQFKMWGSSSWASVKSEDDTAKAKAIAAWNTRALSQRPDTAGWQLVPGVAYRHRAVFIEGWSEWITEVALEDIARQKAENRPDLYEVRDLYISAAPQPPKEAGT